VAAQDRGHNEVADTRQSEHRFGHDRATDQKREGKTEDGDHRDECVAQRMVQNHTRFREPFGTRGANVVFAQDVEHARPREAQDQRGVDHAQDDRRQYQMMQAIAQGHARVAVARDRKPAEAHRENLHQDQPEPEARDTRAKHGEARKDLVDGLAAPDGCNDAAGNTDQCGDEHRSNSQDQSAWQGLHQYTPYIPLALI